MSQVRLIQNSGISYPKCADNSQSSPGRSQGMNIEVFSHSNEIHYNPVSSLQMVAVSGKDQCPIESPSFCLGNIGKLKYSSGGITLEEFESNHAPSVDRATGVVGQTTYCTRTATESNVKMIFRNLRADLDSEIPARA